MRQGLKWMTLLTSAGMFLVLLAGALVTKTDSGRGCGDDWPLCNGKFIPAYTIESMLEYSHRAVSGIVGIMVLITAIWIYRAVKDRKDIQLYAYTALFFTVIQAILGAMAVKWEQSSAVMALHFGFSLIAFASTMLLAITVWRLPAPTHPSGWGVAYSDSYKVTKGFRNLVWFTTIYTYVVVYIGAFVRHTDSAGGCVGWPLCNNQVIPDWSPATAVAFGHRIAALLLFFVILWMVYRAVVTYGKMKVIKVSGWASIVMILLQILSGGWVSLTFHSENIHLLASLVHTLVISGLFGMLCYLSILVWQLAKDTQIDKK